MSIMKTTLAALLLLITTLQPALAQNCNNWLNIEFWQTASDNDIHACIKAGAKINARNKNGLRPLHYAANSNKNPSIITTLLDAGADVEARNKNGLRPLHLAAISNKNPSIITTLLNAGADVEARDKYGNTPLHAAAFNNKNSSIITTLLDAGADVTIKAQGRSAFEWFEKNNHGDAIESHPDYWDVYWQL